MTHDELLAKIDIWKFQTQGYDDTYEVHGILNALRAAAVVTQAPPVSNQWQWADGWKCAMLTIIQAIEKELGS